jgi:hypothetical protein
MWIDGEHGSDFWAALGRLYDSTQNLVTATGMLAETAQAHERRLDKLDVIVEWLASEQRKRDQASGN